MATSVPSGRLLEEGWDSKAAKPLAITWRKLFSLPEMKRRESFWCAAHWLPLLLRLCCLLWLWLLGQQLLRCCYKDWTKWRGRGGGAVGRERRRERESEPYQTRKSIYILGTNWLRNISCHQEASVNGENTEKMRAGHSFNARTFCLMWSGGGETASHYPLMLVPNFRKHLSMSISRPCMQGVISPGSSDKQWRHEFIYPHYQALIFQIQTQSPRRSQHVSNEIEFLVPSHCSFIEIL